MAFTLPPDESLEVGRGYRLRHDTDERRLSLFGPDGDLMWVDDGQQSMTLPGGVSAPNLRGIDHVAVSDSSDLPATSNGRHQLADDTVYEFDGIVTSTSGLELGDNSPLVGAHAGHDGFINTGGGAAIYGRDVPFFCDALYVHSPGGTLFDLQGTSEEFLCTLSSFNNAAGVGNISTLGTIDGFRVPTFINANFGNFDAGLTLTGSPDKVHFVNTPFREVTASNVTCVTFDGSFSTDIGSFQGCYVKGVQPDTVVIDYQGTLPTEVFQYLSTTHDSTVTQSNILTGNVGVGVVGVRVSDSYPLADSRTTGVLSLDSETTTTISSQNTYTLISGATTLASAERVTQAGSDAQVQAEGRRRVKVHLEFNGSFTGQNGDLYEFAFFLNGSVLSETETVVEARGKNAPLPVSFTTIQEVSDGDTFSAHVKNDSSTSDLTMKAYNVTITGA